MSLFILIMDCGRRQSDLTNLARVLLCLVRVDVKYTGVSRVQYSAIQYALADKSGNMFDFCGNISSNRAGAWSRHAIAMIFRTTQQPNSMIELYFTQCLELLLQ